MSYTVKEIYYTLQGEGMHAGRAAIFCRFTGCNLWSGRERDRPKAICQFCDTDFVGMDGPLGGRYRDADALVATIQSAWVGDRERVTPLVVCTGGEPLLQLDTALIDRLHEEGFEVAVETNGTKPAPPGLDHVCVSPKAGAPLVVTRGDELKLVYPQPEALPDLYSALDFKRFYLQPMDGPQGAENTAAAVAYCLAHPQWHLSVQTHKMVGIP